MMQPTLQVPIRVATKGKKGQTGLPSEQWTVCHRLVVPHPEYEDGSLELLWERQGDLQRVGVYTGPDSPIRSLHFSLRLPVNKHNGPLMAHSLHHHRDSVVPRSRMILTRFAEDKHPTLCCLLDSHTLVLFDIYPDKYAPNPLPTEGWTIPLPFECASIFSAEPGLLFQREDDVFNMPVTPISATPRMGWKHHIPAPPLALGGQTDEHDTTQPLSLFSLHHYLEDILPVSMSHSFNPKENVIWVGTLSNDFNARRYVVTYRNVHQHFGNPVSSFKIYQLDPTPPPPEKPPLHQQVRSRYDTVQRFDSSLPDDALLFEKYWQEAEEIDTGSVEMGVTTTSFGGNLSVRTTLLQEVVVPPPLSRDQALATALGVRTPRSPIDHANESSSMLLCGTATALQAKLETKLIHSVTIPVSEPTGWRDGTKLQVFPLNDMLVIRAEETLRLVRMTDSGCMEDLPYVLEKVASAQPINGGHKSGRWLMLILRSLKGAGPLSRCLELYRADQRVASVVINGNEQALEDLSDSVSDRVTVHPAGRISISLETNVEQVLSTLSFDKELELWFRVDLHSHRQRDCWPILRGLLIGIASNALRGGRMNAGSIVENFMDQRCDKVQVFRKLYDALHHLAEEYKLSGNSGRATSIALLLVDMLQIYKLVHGESNHLSIFQEYHNAFLESSGAVNVTVPSNDTGAGIRMPFSSFSEPPSIFKWIENAIKATGEPPSYVGFSYDGIDRDLYPLTRTVFRCYSSLFDRRLTIQERRKGVVQALLNEGFRYPEDVQEVLLPGVAMPLIETLLYFRNNANSVNGQPWDDVGWDLIGRSDLSKNAKTPIKCVTGNDMMVHIRESQGEGGENDGLFELEKQAAMVFPDDNRIREAGNLLKLSTPVAMSVDRPVEASDHDYERLKQRRLLVLCIRSFATSVGRGMLTLGNYENPPVMEVMPIPQICLKGRLLPTNVTVNLEEGECPPEFMIWPNFHNGVAAGLRLPFGDGRKTSFEVTRSYIRFNRPPLPDEGEEETQAPQMAKQDAHAGLLLALGLRGQLDCLEMTDVYEYLTQGNVTTTVGLLLGLAANKRGSCDLQASKMMSLHIPSLIPQHFSAIDVASPVQTAAVASSGLLYQGSGHRMMTEFLLNEIGRRPDSDVSTVDRESYSLTCGIALGTVNLGHCKFSSEQKSGLADLNIEERLIRYVAGGADPDEQRRIREATDRFSLRSADTEGEAERCSTVYEGKEINTSICAPGAVFALGLMFLKSENTSIASRLALPDTHFLLEFVRPDFVTLLIVSRSLIMWNEVQPSDVWIQSQIPSVVLEARNYIMIRAKQSLLGKAHNSGADPNFDFRAVREMYVHAVSGACFGIGIRFAGTGNIDAKHVLMERVEELYALRKSSDPTMAALRPEIPSLETCLGCATISLAMVMAGTGDIEVLKLLRVLRWECSEDSRYGIHMVYGMAIGLLFLGGGKCTLGREPEDIAALLFAFFPRFPSGTFDNQFHLQALRHLYVLATKPRVLQTIDVDTGNQVAATVCLSSGSGKQKELQTPSLLLNDDEEWKSLEVSSAEYYPLKLEFSLVKSQMKLHVMRRRLETPTTQILPITQRPRGFYSKNFKKLILSDDSTTSFAFRIFDQTDRLSANEILPLYLRLRYEDECIGESFRTLRSYLRHRQNQDDESGILDDRLILPFLQEVAVTKLNK